MKKITLLLLIAMATSLVAQNVIIDRPVNNANSIIATLGTNGGVFIGDQFEITEEIAIGTIEVFGFNSNGGNLGDLLLGFNVYIYEEEASLPAGDPSMAGTGLFELSNIDLANVTHTEDGFGESNFLINITDANDGNQIVLSPGTYWLSLFPTVDSGAADAGRWNWELSSSTPPIEPVLIDPSDIFGAGITSWSNIAGLIGASATSMAWQLVDEEVLSTDENVITGLKISPNPTTGIVNIALPLGQTLKSLTLYDVLGREVLNRTGTITSMDLTNYTPGIYLAQLVTEDGIIQAVRVVKQ